MMRIINTAIPESITPESMFALTKKPEFRILAKSFVHYSQRYGHDGNRLPDEGLDQLFAATQFCLSWKNE